MAQKPNKKDGCWRQALSFLSDIAPGNSLHTQHSLHGIYATKMCVCGVFFRESVCVCACVCVCVCVRMRERERERECVVLQVRERG